MHDGTQGVNDQQCKITAFRPQIHTIVYQNDISHGPEDDSGREAQKPRNEEESASRGN